MECCRYDEFQKGRVDEAAFRGHLENCPSCLRHFETDERLMCLARSLKEPVNAPHLWTRIEKAIRGERASSESAGTRIVRSRAIPALRLAAVVAAALGIAFVAGLRLGRRDASLLTDPALKRVERRERAYIAAIEVLEERVQPRLQKIEIELVLLYRDRLETIDTQIERCKEELLENPANAHVRRYMLAALQDKRQTLKELFKRSS